MNVLLDYLLYLSDSTRLGGGGGGNESLHPQSEI
jgi:hypothetical protein